MDLTLFAGIAVSTSSTIALNVGKGIQKMKVDVLTKGRHMFSKEHRNDFLIWALGVLITASSIGLYSYAMKLTDKPSTVSSCTGLGLIGLVLFAKYVLKETVGKKEIAGCAFIVICTLLLTMNDKKVMTPHTFHLSELIKYSALIISLFSIFALYSLKTKKFHGIVFGSLAGIMIGIGLFLGDIALVESNGDLIGQLYTPYPYIAFMAAVSALVLTQIGFLKGRAVIVVPCINSCTILTPILLEYWIYGITLNTTQYGSILGILGGVMLLSSTGMERINSQTHTDPLA